MSKNYNRTLKQTITQKLLLRMTTHNLVPVSHLAQLIFARLKIWSLVSIGTKSHGTWKKFTNIYFLRIHRMVFISKIDRYIYNPSL